MVARISKEQRAGQYDVWQTSLHNPDFADYARRCGAYAERVSSRAELDDAMAAVMAHDGPAMLHVVTDADLV